MALFDPALFDPSLLDSAGAEAAPLPMTLFDPVMFDPTHFDTSLVLVPGDPPPAVIKPRRGVPINAYKQFKFIDRSGNTYYVKRG